MGVKLAKNQEPKYVEVYLEMQEELQPLADAFAANFAKIASDDVLAHYDFGAELNNLIGGDRAAYGAKAIKAVADWVRRSTSEIYALRNFAAKFAREQVERAARRRT